MALPKTNTANNKIWITTEKVASDLGDFFLLDSTVLPWGADLTRVMMFSEVAFTGTDSLIQVGPSGSAAIEYDWLIGGLTGIDTVVDVSHEINKEFARFDAFAPMIVRLSGNNVIQGTEHISFLLEFSRA